VSAPLVEFLLRFREREKENAAQGTNAAPGPISLAVGSHPELMAEAQTRQVEQALPR
jgi:hypothetical protein